METTLTVQKKGLEFNKRLFIFFMVLFAIPCLVFAQSNTDAGIDGIDTIKTVFGTIYAFFTSAAVRIIAIAGVIFTGIKMITNKGNPEAMKPLIMILIACIIIGAASWFVEKFMGNQIKSDVKNYNSWY